MSKLRSGNQPANSTAGSKKEANQHIAIIKGTPYWSQPLWNKVPNMHNWNIWKISRHLVQIIPHPNLSSPIETITPTRNSSGCWSRSVKDRTETFALHLIVFQPNPASNVYALQQIYYETQPKVNIISAVRYHRSQVAKTQPGSDLIATKLIMEILYCAVEVICQLSHEIVSLSYHPTPNGKNLLLYRSPGMGPISLLSCLSKLFENWFLFRSWYKAWKLTTFSQPINSASKKNIELSS